MNDRWCFRFFAAFAFFLLCCGAMEVLSEVVYDVPGSPEGWPGAYYVVVKGGAKVPITDRQFVAATRLAKLQGCAFGLSLASVLAAVARAKYLERRDPDVRE